MGRAVPLALVMVMATAVAAWADSLSVDGDTLKAGNDLRYETTDTGTARACTELGSGVTGQAEVKRTGAAPNLSAGESVTLTLESPHAGITVSGPHVATVPNPWSGGAVFQINYTTTVSGTVPDGEYVVDAKVVGASSGFELTDTFTVRITCTPSDTTPPTITINEPGDGDHFILGEVVNADFSCVDNESPVTQCEGTVAHGDPIDTSTPGSHTFRVDAASAGGTSFLEHTYFVDYAACGGATSLSILQPIDADGSSVFKQKSTVPAKFQVCDANGNPVGTAGVVDSFNLVRITNGTDFGQITEVVDSTVKATSEFRYDPTAGQWIFNMNTKNLSAGKTYWYKITVDSGQTIEFSFGLK